MCVCNKRDRTTTSNCGTATASRLSGVYTGDGTSGHFNKRASLSPFYRGGSARRGTFHSARRLAEMVRVRNNGTVDAYSFILLCCVISV